MKKLYEKSALNLLLCLVAIYCVLQSLAYPLNEITDRYAGQRSFLFLTGDSPFHVH